MSRSNPAQKLRPLFTVLILFLCIALIFINYIFESKSEYFPENAPSDSGSESLSFFPELRDNILQFKTIDLSTLSMIRTDDAYAVYIGDTLSPEIKLIPPTADAQLSYSVSSADIAVIDENGTITGISEGRSTVNITDSSGISASYEIVVKKKMPDPAKDYPSLFDEKIVIVNVNNPLSKSYEPNVVKTSNVVPSKAAELSLDAEALKHYALMHSECKKATGENVKLITGYRSYSTQSYIFNQQVAKFTDKGYSKTEAKTLAGQTVQPPGKSEHQLGVSIDIGISLSVSDTFHKTKAGAWITEHAHEYGWILRYPADKVELTGINYEPWHFRYVGTEHATYIYNHGLCLEEYVLLQEEAAQNAIEYSADHPAACD